MTAVSPREPGPNRHFNLRLRATPALVAASSLLLATAPAHSTAPTATVEKHHRVLPLASCGFVHADSGLARDERGHDVRRPGRPQGARRAHTTPGGHVLQRAHGQIGALSGNWRVTRHYTDGQLNGTAVQTGRTYTVTVPGRGVIFHQSGSGIQENGEIVFQAGPHDFDEANLAELCDYLSR